MTFWWRIISYCIRIVFICKTGLICQYGSFSLLLCLLTQKSCGFLIQLSCDSYTFSLFRHLFCLFMAVVYCEKIQHWNLRMCYLWVFMSIKNIEFQTMTTVVSWKWERKVCGNSIVWIYTTKRVELSETVIACMLFEFDDVIEILQLI